MTKEEKAQYMKAYHARRKEDPEYQERRRAQQRKSKAEKLADQKKRDETNARWTAANNKRLENPEYRKKKNAQSRDHYTKKAQDPEYRQAISLRHRCRKFGIEIERYEQMVEEQDNRCAICGRHERLKYKGTVKALASDHCHSTGKVRALLCDWCNTGIGRFDDDIAMLKKAIAYLEAHQD